MHAYRPNHYEELGVPRDADAEAIRTAWRALAKEVHPDLSESDGSEAREAFLRLQEAYDVLRDPERRAQYDRELDRGAARAEAARVAARRPIRPKPRPMARPVAAAAPRRPVPHRSSRLLALSGFLAAIGLVLIVTAGIVVWPLLFQPDIGPIVSVNVDPNDLGRSGRGSATAVPSVPADPGILTKEADRALQAQIERVEAARKRVEAQRGELEAHKAPAGSSSSASTPSASTPSAGSAQPQAPTMLVPRAECIDRATNIVLTREGGVVMVSYDNAPPVQPRISDLGTGTILVSRIEPTNKFAIAFTRGERNSTMLLMFGQAGNLQHAITVKCSVAAF
jgi:hypothetical protein